jgi:hypothetical protein
VIPALALQVGPEILPIDVEGIIAIVMGISIVLIPVAGLTLRFAIKPAVEALARAFEHQGLEDTVSILERRMGFLESQMETMEHTVDRLAEAVEFQNELRSGRDQAPTSLPPGVSAGATGEEVTGRDATG